jgi:hypothetical protein
MTWWEIVEGRKPFWRDRNPPAITLDQSYATIINTQTPHNFAYKPDASAEVIQETILAEQSASEFVSGRFTLNPVNRTKILDDRPSEWDVYITIPIQGVVAYATHSGVRAVQTAANIHEGIPLTNNPNVQGRPTANHLKWKGELWLSGDTVGMVVDVEAS